MKPFAVHRAFSVIVLLTALVPNPSFAAILDVSVNTTPLITTRGYVAVVLIDGNGSTGSSSVIDGWETDGTAHAVFVSGAVSGNLPGPVVIGDGDFFNELLIEVTFGSSITFTTDVRAPGPVLPFPDVFALSLLDEDLVPYATDDPEGADALFEVLFDSPEPINMVYNSAVADVFVREHSAEVSLPGVSWLLITALGWMRATRGYQLRQQVKPVDRLLRRRRGIPRNPTSPDPARRIPRTPTPQARGSSDLRLPSAP